MPLTFPNLIECFGISLYISHLTKSVKKNCIVLKFIDTSGFFPLNFGFVINFQFYCILSNEGIVYILEFIEAFSSV